MDNIKLFLNSNRSKKSVNAPFYQDVELKANKKMFTEENINGIVNAFDLYNEERNATNKVRLVCSINPVCSNVLFNPVTEIVKDEGSESPLVLNYKELKNSDICRKNYDISSNDETDKHPIKPIINDDSKVIDNSSFIWNEYEAIRDTQLSSNDFGFKYHCGVDIFNNHLLRSDTFKIVSYNKDNSNKRKSDGRRGSKLQHFYIDQYFNTIDDWMRDSRGNIVYNNFFNPFLNPDSILYNYEVSNFNGSNKVKNEKDLLDFYDFYATFDFKLKINDAKNIISLTQNTTIKIEFDYELTEYSTNVVRTKHAIYTDILAADNTDKTIQFKVNSTSDDKNGSPYFDKHLVDYRIIDSSINVVINGTNNAAERNVYYKTVTTFGGDNDTFVGTGGHFGNGRRAPRDFGGRTFEGGFSGSRGSHTTVYKYDLVYSPLNGNTPDTFSNASHLYQSYDVKTFEETIKDKLIEDNGWFGFKNTSKLPTYDVSSEKTIDISKPINSENSSSFIDMYPGRDLYSFTPKYNKYKNRIEPNWDYCLTYPSSSMTKGFDFINEETGGLKIQMFDEFTIGDSGEHLITFYCLSQHGLRVGDYVNIYKNGTDKVVSNAIVSNVYDKYIFQINKNGISISNKWHDVSDSPKEFSGDGITYSKDPLNEGVYVDDTPSANVYYVLPDTQKVNLDTDYNNLSFKRVVSNVECKYYVRIFSKIPNFKFCDTEINDKTLYDKTNNRDLIKEYSDKDHAFGSHINRVGFSKNIYGDEISEIVFTDDIDLTALKDNLGRPLTDIYLTIVKRNKGYKSWYGISPETKIDVTADDIEYSHCFGKNSCSLRLSDDSLNYIGVNDIRKIDSETEGLNIKKINETSSFDVDEIVFDECQNFYGDLCCYSPIDALEESIQPILNRFNTAQRDLKISDEGYKYFSSFKVDMIDKDETAIGYGDPYEIQVAGLHSTQITYNSLPRREGYYYQTHYKIPVKTISSKLSEQLPLFHTILDITKDGDYFKIYTDDENGFTINEKPILYDKDENKVYVCLITEIITSKKFVCKILDEEGKKVNLTGIEDISRYNLLSKDGTIPSYAKIIKDGSCRYLWREVLQNGFDDNSNVEVYPFTNGALYINRNINFYLRRQNPSDEPQETIELSENNAYISYEDKGEVISKVETEDNYVSEKNMKEC